MAELATTLTPTEEDRLDQAEAMVRTYCGWHIAPSREETVVLDGPGSQVLLLPSLYVTAIASVVEAGVELDPANDYQWSRSGVVNRWYGATWPDAGTCGHGWWTSQLRGIEVTMTHGYETVPVEVTGVVQAIASRLIDNPSGLQQQTVGPFSETYSGAGSALGAAEEAILGKYLLPWRV